MSPWLRVDSAALPPRRASQARTCMINTSNNINPPSSSTRQCAHALARALTARRSSHACIQAQCTQIHAGLRTSTETLAPPPPPIMVNTSKSISFLDSWSLDRHGSDSPWFPLWMPPPHTSSPPPTPFTSFPTFLYSLWSLPGRVTEHAAKIDCLTYYLLLFCKLV